jgi:hypothetical protein
MTSHASPALRTFADELLTTEAASPHEPADGTSAYRVCEKLRRPLSTLAGATGFHSLVARALMLAKREVPELQGVHVGPDGALLGLADIEPRAARALAEIALITNLLDLVASFIGEELTMTLVQDAWRRATDDDLHFPRGADR